LDFIYLVILLHLRFAARLAFTPRATTIDVAWESLAITAVIFWRNRQKYTTPVTTVTA